MSPGSPGSPGELGELGELVRLATRRPLAASEEDRLAALLPGAARISPPPTAEDLAHLVLRNEDAAVWLYILPPAGVIDWAAIAAEAGERRQLARSVRERAMDAHSRAGEEGDWERRFAEADVRLFGGLLEFLNRP